MQTVANKTFDEIAPGDAASVERTLQAGDVRAWAAAFGDGDVLAGPGESQAAAGIVTAMLTALVGSARPGSGSSIRAVSVEIKGALPISTTMTVRLVVREKRPGQGIVVLDGRCTDPTGQVVASAILEVLAPTMRQRRQVAEHRLEGLIERCQGLKPMPSGVVHPCSDDALAGAVEAAEAGLIEPVLFGPEAEIRQIADLAHLDIVKYRIVGTDGAEDSALKAAAAAGAGEVGALMKGSLHTDVLLHAIMQKEAKLRAGRLISHCVMMSVPTYARRFVISDVALNIAPDTDQKRDICQNAIGFARALGIGQPKVAVLAAVEMVRTNMPASRRRRDPGEDGGPSADRRRYRRRPARPRCRGGCRRGADQAYRIAGRGPRRCSDRAEHRSRKHGLQESRLHGRCAGRGPRRRCAGARDPDQPGRHHCRAPFLGCRHRAVRRCTGARSLHPAPRNGGVIRLVLTQSREGPSPW